MSLDSNTPSQRSKSSPQVKSSFWEFLYVLYNWKWFLMSTFAGIMLIVTIILLFIPRYYKSEASVLPPQSQGLLGSLGGLSSMLRNVSPLISMGRSGFGGDLSFTYLAILNSRSVMDSVIEKFDLAKVYRITSYPMMYTEKQLRANARFDIDENGAINISVIDKDAVRAASMANYFVDLLNEIYVKISVEEAHNNRLFIQQQYEKNLADLKRSEDTLEAFQEHYKVYDVPQQAKAAIATGADLEAQRIAAEVQLNVLERQFGSDAPEVKLKNLQVEEIQKKLNEMQYGTGRDFSGSGNFFPAFEKVPELGIAYLRLYRDYEIQTKLLEFTLPMFEQAKIEEQKNTPAVIVLDRAIPAEKPTVPKRLFIEVVVAFFVLSLLTYFVHLFNRLLLAESELNPLEVRVRSFARRVAERSRAKIDIE